MIFSRISGAGAALLFCVTAASYGLDVAGVKITPTGQAAIEFGQIVHGEDHGKEIDHVTFDKIYLQTGLTAQLSEKTTFSGNVEVKTFNEYPRQIESGYTRRYYYYFYLTQAELTRRFFIADNLTVNVGGGYFPYKYNENVRNLGEFLFRSTAYPQTINTEFDFPFARLAGFYGRGTYTTGLATIKLDLLATINTEWMAIGDLNLSAIASCNLAKIFEIGAGVEFGSVVSAEEAVTTPKNDATRYLNGTDTANFSFRGTKLMGRFSIDPKNIFGSPSLFGDQDLKIYGEAALLGVKNYDAAMSSPIWYNSILERIPVMLGINLPAFKVLDALSVEGEWWGNRYPNSMEGIIREGLPLPFQTSVKSIAEDSTTYKQDNLKWSVYGARTFAKHYRLSFQVASDHMRTFAWDWYRQDWEEALKGPKKWYYVLKFGVLI